jgi:hypothetical protein
MVLGNMKVQKLKKMAFMNSFHPEKTQITLLFSMQPGKLRH